MVINPILIGVCNSCGDSDISAVCKDCSQDLVDPLPYMQITHAWQDGYIVVTVSLRGGCD